MFRFPHDDQGKPAKDAEAWNWTENNVYIMLAKPHMLAFGGGNGAALCIDDSLGMYQLMWKRQRIKQLRGGGVKKRQVIF